VQQKKEKGNDQKISIFYPLMQMHASHAAERERGLLLLLLPLSSDMTGFNATFLSLSGSLVTLYLSYPHSPLPPLPPALTPTSVHCCFPAKG